MASRKRTPGWVYWSVGAAAGSVVVVAVLLAVVLLRPPAPGARPDEAPDTPAGLLAEARTEEKQLLERLRSLNESNHVRQTAVSARRQELVDLQADFESLTGQSAPM